MAACALASAAGVVEAVADHQHLAALRRASASIGGGLVLRRAAGAPGVDAGRLGRARRRARPGRRRGSRPRGRAACSAATVSAASARRASAKRKRTLVSPSKPNHSSVSRRRRRAHAEEGGAAEAGAAAVDQALDALAGDARVTSVGQRARRRPPPPARGPAGGARRAPAARPWRRAAGAASSSRGRPSVSTPVLSKTTWSTSASRSSAAPDLTSTPRAEQPRRGGDLHGRHRQAQRAGAGDDQHRHGADQRLARAQAQRPAAGEGQQRRRCGPPAHRSRPPCRRAARSATWTGRRPRPGARWRPAAESSERRQRPQPQRRRRG